MIINDGTSQIKIIIGLHHCNPHQLGLDLDIHSLLRTVKLKAKKKTQIIVVFWYPCNRKHYILSINALMLVCIESKHLFSLCLSLSLSVYGMESLVFASHVCLMHKNKIKSFDYGLKIAIIHVTLSLKVETNCRSLVRS